MIKIFSTSSMIDTLLLKSIGAIEMDQWLRAMDPPEDLGLIPSSFQGM